MNSPLLGGLVSVFDFSIFFFFKKFFGCGFFFFFLIFCLIVFFFDFLRFFTFGQVKSNARDGRSRHPTTNQSFRVCKVNIATVQVANKKNPKKSKVQ